MALDSYQGFLPVSPSIPQAFCLNNVSDKHWLDFTSILPNFTHEPHQAASKKLPFYKAFKIVQQENCRKTAILFDTDCALSKMIDMKRQVSHPGEAKSEVLKAIPNACVNETAAVEFMEKQRWGDTPTCPHCKRTAVVKMMNEDRTARNARFLWRCHDCGGQFTVRVGTVFEGSRIPLRTWCHAFWRACSSKKGVSALQISRECSITYKSSLFLMHRIRFAMEKAEPKEKLKGTVETDETYIGGKPRKKGTSKRGRGTKKTPVLAMVQRPGKVRARVIANVTAKTLKREMLKAIDLSARLNTDELKAYRKIGKEFAGGHGTVMHSAEEYVNETGDHVNTAEEVVPAVVGIRPAAG